MRDGEKFSQELSCRLTKSEIKERSSTLAAKLHEVAVLEEDRKRDATEARQRVNGVKLEISRLADAVRTGAETREVECVREYNFKTGEVNAYRCDTGEVVSSRRMAPAERQSVLPSPVRRRPAPEAEGFDPRYDERHLEVVRDDDEDDDQEAEDDAVEWTGYADGDDDWTDPDDSETAAVPEPPKPQKKTRPTQSVGITREAPPDYDLGD